MSNTLMIRDVVDPWELHMLVKMCTGLTTVSQLMALGRKEYLALIEQAYPGQDHAGATKAYDQCENAIGGSHA